MISLFVLLVYMVTWHIVNSWGEKSWGISFAPVEGECTVVTGDVHGSLDGIGDEKKNFQAGYLLVRNGTGLWIAGHQGFQTKQSNPSGRLS